MKEVWLVRLSLPIARAILPFGGVNQKSTILTI